MLVPAEVAVPPKVDVSTPNAAARPLSPPPSGAESRSTNDGSKAGGPRKGVSIGPNPNPGPMREAPNGLNGGIMPGPMSTITITFKASDFE